jgi:hypothetical protein
MGWKQLSSLGSVIKSAYEAEDDTNAYTDADKAAVAAYGSSATNGNFGQKVTIGNDELTVDDLFYLGTYDLDSADSPAIYFDDKDYIRYNRSVDRFGLYINNTVSALFEPTLVTLSQDLELNGTDGWNATISTSALTGSLKLIGGSSVPGSEGSYIKVHGSSHSSAPSDIHIDAQYVGINNTSPTAPLDVGGNISLTPSVGAESRLTIGQGRSTGNGTSTLQIMSNTADSASWGLAVTRWGAGDGAVSNKIGNLYIETTDSSFMALTTNSSEAVRITSDQKVGVNTTLPQTELHINGAMAFDEITPPSTPAANDAYIYAKDNGSGKTQVVIKLPDGLETVLATET